MGVTLVHLLLILWRYFHTDEWVFQNDRLPKTDSLCLMTQFITIIHSRHLNSNYIFYFVSFNSILFISSNLEIMRRYNIFLCFLQASLMLPKDLWSLLSGCMELHSYSLLWLISWRRKYSKRSLPQHSGLQVSRFFLQIPLL